MAKTRYYGGFQFPAHMRFKTKPQPKAKPPPAPPLAPVIVFPEGLVSFSSGKQACGVNEYSTGLARQMRLAGAQVTEELLDDAALLSSARPGAEVLIHIEPSLLRQGFDAALRTAYLRRAKIVLCFHYFDGNLLRRFADSADVLALHRDYGVKHSKIRQVPLACPVYAPTDRNALRRKYGLPEGKKIVTTLGFLTAWKRIPETVQRLLPELERRGVLLQLLCPTHYSGDPSKEANKLRNVIHGHPSVLWQSTFLPEQEMLERVAASDLGFVYHGENTGSCSAANKMFVAARCPLLLTSSNHDSDVQHGAMHLKGFDLGQFAQRAVDLVHEDQTLKVLAVGMEKDYERMNQRAVAQRYLGLFKEIVK